MTSRIALVPNDAESGASSVFTGTGEMARHCRSFDWCSHPLGCVEDWPTSLRCAVALVMQSPFPMMLLWGDDLTQLYNDSYITLMGRGHPAALGNGAKQSRPDLWQINAPIYERVRAGENVMVEEASYTVTRNDRPEDAWFKPLGYSPVQDDAGTVNGVFVCGFETTGAVIARRRADSANRAKGDFLAVMSHELRTPLNAIGGYAELLSLGVRGPVNTDQREDLERIQHNQRHLLDVINGVLAYAKVEAGVLHYKVEDVPMDALLARCVALVALEAKDASLTLSHTGCISGLTARADEEKVELVVLNLIRNAIKFTEPGGVVTLSCLAEEEKRLIVRVSDTGRGIAQDNLECVFQPFVQVDAQRTRAHEGTGLGLAISRELARGMGGDITVVSAPNEGSTFSLVLACGRGADRLTEAAAR